MWKWEADNAKAVMVMVHGAGEHHGRYSWLIEMWRAAGFHVIMGDLPGQGTSTRRRGHIDSFDEYIEAVEMWLKEAFTYELPVFLLGHSMGGLIAIRSMQEKHFPVAAVLLSSPALGLVEPPPKRLEMASKALNAVLPGAMFDSHLKPGMGTRNREINEMDENDSLIVRKVSVRWYRELVQAIKQASEQVLNFPDVPVLLFQGGEDKIIDKVLVREFFDKLPVNEKMYKEWAGLYHEVFNDPEREQVFEMAKSFVDMTLENLAWEKKLQNEQE
ncbi:alpha/beta hydrolase [Bacillus marinisedimentorum]|uniref:alpha/beta hydrolase n=1 Tax=Bacillus marinisedimentorum TaxID=1821260 RepID=UPI0008734A55|nr:alpha/beta hydrolase [Bacillus marinisedimentorum]